MQSLPIRQYKGRRGEARLRTLKKIVFSMSSTCSNKMFAYSLLVLIVLCTNYARVRADSNALSKEITEIIENTRKCQNKPALAVSVVKDGSVVYSRGFGSRDLDHQVNVTSSTVFGVASLSKAFAATLILKLLDENSKYDFFYILEMYI